MTYSTVLLLIKTLFTYEKFENVKGVIRSRNSKNGQYNCQKQKRQMMVDKKSLKMPKGQ